MISSETKPIKIKEYYLTDRGIDLYNIIYELQLWTLNHVTFNESENTKIWQNTIKLESKETTIKIIRMHIEN